MNVLNKADILWPIERLKKEAEILKADKELLIKENSDLAAKLIMATRKLQALGYNIEGEL